MKRILIVVLALAALAASACASASAASPRQVGIRVHYSRFEPNRIEALVLRAAAYRQVDATDLAVDDIARALSLQPQFPDAYLERGTLRAIKGDFDGARADWTHVKELAPGSFDSCVPLGRRLFAAGDKNLDFFFRIIERAARRNSFDIGFVRASRNQNRNARNVVTHWKKAKRSAIERRAFRNCSAI